ncbi:MAG: thioredoxin family protein [Gammaproteobacteria bacterium]|nr:thioredoxin family protein [Gammaproteobacteria bacterium]
MSGLLFLNSDDFNVQAGTKGRILCNPIPGFSLVLFYSNQCQHCKTLIPIFKSLPGSMGGCQFGLINVGSNMDVVRKSKGTVTEIKYVPLVILYVNGKPFMRYAGKHKKDDLMKFIVQMSKRVQTKTTFANDKNVKEDPRGGIPAYTIGHPLIGEDDVCYLEFEKAYLKERQNARTRSS